MVVALRGQSCPAGGADRVQGVVVDLAAGHHRDVIVEERHQCAQQAGFGLPAQTEQDEVMARQQGVDELRNDRVVVADDAGEERPPGAQPGDEIVPDFFVDGAMRHAAGLDGAAQLANGGNLGSDHTRFYTHE